VNRPDFHQWRDDLANDVQFGYVSGELESPRHFHPRVVLNSSEASVLRVIREEIRKCQSFVFSVAFVSPNALAMLKTDLIEFRGKGTIVTSDYLAFNSPQAFAELISLGERGFGICQGG
jgi:HKD family nuclease